MAQTNRGELDAIRKIVAGQKLKAAPPAGHDTPNQVMAGWAAAYGSDPQAGRADLLAFLRWQLEVSYWSHAASEEIGTGSHCAIFYGGMDGLLLFALRNGDAEILEAIVKVQETGMALETLCATPKGHVVIAGARCWVANAQTPGGGDADQRAIRDLRWQYLQGQRIRSPQTLGTALDWTGLWALTQIDAALKAGASWAKPWPAIKARIKAAGPDKLPPSRNAMTIERGPHGHRVSFANTTGMLRPAEWAVVDYLSGMELYGCDPLWPKGQPGGALHPDTLPMPAFPGGGAPVKVWHLGAAKP